MSVQSVEVLVVGAGQAGVAMSAHLGERGISHVVLERDRIAEAWRTGRWDSLVANGPAWHDRFPGLEHEVDGDRFPGKDQVAAYFERFAEKIEAPIRTGVTVTLVRKHAGRAGFHVETTDGTYDARYVVAATGPFQVPAIPPLVPEDAGIHQLHSRDYRNPDQLPAGGVLVVGAGASGSQIADELARAGRDVWLAVGPHSRPPRQYRGRDFTWWLGVLGHWERTTPPDGGDHVTIAVSGANGGETVDFRTIASRGVRLVGRANAYANGTLRFAPDLLDNIKRGDQDYLDMLERCDRYAERNGLDLPEEPGASVLGPYPADALEPVEELDLAAAGITTILWATGYRTDYSWLQVDALDADGRPQHERGISTEPGVYFLGLPWLSRRGSSFIWGVWNDAKFIADQIAIQQSYLAYEPAAPTALEAPELATTTGAFR
ncbi:NAD(P)/FAD-dependent oxidoreductase [Agrococcus sp. HG114]|uniref:flavin-containing monooxygenase n=1 Tax=Agrococcus sp. HG114 TaxID=2969757 RepID=UPI00215AD5E6|nr:NAD(P)/FAD-dependent oxidoreductase [Agrococcus sp. HG114]MCR8669566.1 NAD(P)/FAD-dependent oxidoreductase [Agrococcus sp. HG114]